jgi:hypothetical protein
MNPTKVFAAVGLSALFAGSICGCGTNPAPYVAPFATEIMFVNVPTEQLADYGVDVPSTVAITVAVGHLTNPENPSTSSPFSGEGVSGATVTVTGPDGVQHALAEQASDTLPGVYVLTSQTDPTLTYAVGGEYQVDISISNQTFWSKFKASEGVALKEPAEMGEYHAPGTDLTLSWEPQADTVLVDVFDQNGEQIYTNVPQDLDGLYSFVTRTPSTSEVVAGSNFVENNLYGIGLAGLFKTSVGETTFSPNLNWLISNAVTGTAVVSAITTVDSSQIPESRQMEP